MAARHRSYSNGGWTLTELVIVLCILLVLLSLGFVIWTMIRHRVAVGSTTALVGSVATAITTYQTKTWTWQVTPPGTPTAQTRTDHLFDLNHDGLIDGRPAVIASDTEDGGFAPEILASGYQGFVAMTRPDLKKSSIARNLQLVDAWKHPLRIAFAARIYGTQGFGVWSAGPDGIDGTADDLQSWTAATPP